MEEATQDLRYLYADVLIALAQQDNHVDPRERELLEGIFDNMGLSRERLQVLWLTPRTLDVVQAMVQTIDDGVFKRCLLKDCFLLAHADDAVEPAESHFIQTLSSVLDIPLETQKQIRAWVETALQQRRIAEQLFESDS